MLPFATHEEIREVFERCQRRYPTVRLSFEHFSARLDEIVSAGHREHANEPAGDVEAGSRQACPVCLSLFRQLHHEDLFLALACARGDRIAWECFADDYMALLRSFAARACKDFDASEDLAQEIVTALLGESIPVVNNAVQQVEGGNPHALQGSSASQGKLGSYNGRGSLAGWLRASVSHAAIDRFRRNRKQVSLDQLVEQGRSPDLQASISAGGEEERLDAHWGPVMAQALQEEISRLLPRDRLLLSLYHVQGISLKAIGLQFGVHEGTASRWLERVRRGLRKRVERRLRKMHGLTARELRSVWQWISEIEAPLLESVRQPSEAMPQPRKKVQDGTA
jgi:RNA polymerase sigma factor (sigma-70 family)